MFYCVSWSHLFVSSAAQDTLLKAINSSGLINNYQNDVVIVLNGMRESGCQLFYHAYKLYHIT
jgi:hypothetical protein